MATTLTAVTPNIEVVPLDGPPDLARDYTYVPAQQVIYNAPSIPVTAGGDGNEQRCTITCTLPDTSAWLLVETHVSLYGTANTWDEVAALYTRVNFATGTRKYNDIPELYSHGNFAFGSLNALTKVWTPQQPNNRIIFGRDAAVIVELFNQTQNGPAMTLDFSATLLRLSPDQAVNFAPNTPLFTR